MNWITDHIAIGNYLDASDHNALLAEGISAILCLDSNHQAPNPCPIPRTVIPLKDAPGNQMESFLKAIGALERIVMNGKKVLVHCHAGRSRSVVVVAGHLLRAGQLTPEEAIKRVSAKREILITPGVEQLLYYL